MPSHKELRPKVVEAIAACQGSDGCSIMAIKKYIDEVHPEVDFCQLGIRHVLKAGVKAGKFTKVQKKTYRLVAPISKTAKPAKSKKDIKEKPPTPKKKKKKKVVKKPAAVEKKPATNLASQQNSLDGPAAHEGLEGEETSSTASTCAG